MAALTHLELTLRQINSARIKQKAPCGKSESAHINQPAAIAPRPPLKKEVFAESGNFIEPISQQEAPRNSRSYGAGSLQGIAETPRRIDFTPPPQNQLRSWFESSRSTFLETIKEEERLRIARDIHDDLGSTLTAIKFELLRMSNAPLTRGSAITERLNATEALVDNALQAIRTLTTELRPPNLEIGIVAALKWQAAEYEKRMATPCRLICAVKNIPSNSEISIAIFRIFQEALTNISKHANASQIEVDLQSDDGCLTLNIRDNGRGIDQKDMQKSQAYGLHSMQERARRLGGHVSVHRMPKGTVVTLRIPNSPITGATDSPHSGTALFLGNYLKTLTSTASKKSLAARTSTNHT